MREKRIRCSVCGKYHGEGEYYQIVIRHVERKKRGRSSRDASTVKSWNVCERHMRALYNMMDVVTRRVR